MNTKSYELTYIVSPNLSEQELGILIAEITSYIREETGSVEKTSMPSKIKLGYLIKKNAEAFLVSTYFSLSPERLINLEKVLKEQHDILRYIVIAKIKRKEKPEKPRKPQPIKTPQTLEQKVDLNEIDQKIEDILK